MGNFRKRYRKLRKGVRLTRKVYKGFLALVGIATFGLSLFLMIDDITHTR
ncbi:hypothetical protein [Anaerotalea alkaliphila]|uniref:Uncharacterized protein n=1 Tax=Anaerotalea alkaliphila TaxID=2662126 RepID=A0A7X5HTY6_9FIRM|nr:hypothetical protein [Anaerotalea alkaliphila]NDL66356.1 hypothetical protein [Anaerotalea alkaliphila]